jgi:hypothetical protein
VIFPISVQTMTSSLKNHLTSWTESSIKHPLCDDALPHNVFVSPVTVQKNHSAVSLYCLESVVICISKSWVNITTLTYNTNQQEPTISTSHKCVFKYITTANTTWNKQLINGQNPFQNHVHVVHSLYARSCTRLSDLTSNELIV